MFNQWTKWIAGGLGLLGLLPAYAGNDVSLERMFGNVVFVKPLAIVQEPGKSNVWYVVEQAGRVQRVENQAGKVTSTVFADIRDRVESGPNEAGLLGMVFDPGFLDNGRVYLSYTHTQSASTSLLKRLFDNKSHLISRLSRFLSSDGGLTLEVDSENKLMEVEQPYSNHNGGDIHFGPDGYLYYGLGDGGSAGDPHGNGQSVQTLLGAMLRIDVSGREGYTIPVDNPYAKNGGRAEIYAYGLRNPWRWSFDRNTGVLWAGDVGQNQWEEVDKISRAGNYGWNLREGSHCYHGNCKQAGLIDPVVEYSHDDGCSITGGYVYRGKAIPSLVGTYLYGDYCSGTIWGFNADSQEKVAGRILLDTDLNISSFGEDNSGEILVVDLKGRIFKVVRNITP